MLDGAGLRAGARVLDVAAGAGGQTLAAARRVGPTGHVVATDLSPAILEYAAAAARSAGLENVDTRELDGESLAGVESPRRNVVATSPKRYRGPSAAPKVLRPPWIMRLSEGDAVVLTVIPDLPATVVGVEAREKVIAEDYEQVLLPAVDAAEAASSDGKVRLLYVLGPEFPEFTAGAAWEDTKLGLGRLRHWERIAVVGDADWLRRAVHALSWAMPGEVRVFASSDLDEARVWVTS